MRALAERGGPDAVEHLRAVLRDPNPSIRNKVIESIASVGRQDLGLLLREALADSDARVRAAASSGLAQIAP